MTVAAAARMGRVIDIAWAPLPAPVGGGAVLLAATDDGGVAVLDACQAADAAPPPPAVPGCWSCLAGGLACHSPTSAVSGIHVLGVAQLLEGRWFTPAVCKFATPYANRPRGTTAMLTAQGISSA